MPDPRIQNVPPQNIEAEQSVLGGVLLDNESLYKALEVVSEADFYKPAHQKIFRALISLSVKVEPSVLITATQPLKELTILDAAGGSSYLASLINTVPSAANVPYYAKIVREKAILRKLIGICSEIASKGYQETANLDEFLDSA